MRGYLLDTNIVIFWFDENAAEHESVSDQIATLDDVTPLRISSITWGEIEYGHRAVSESDTESQILRNKFVETQLPHTLNIKKTTKGSYGILRARIFDKYAPKGKRRKGLRPEQLIDPVTSIGLGIQENDLWIAAQAIEYNLVLVTHDDMDRILDVAGDLLTIEDWAV